MLLSKSPIRGVKGLKVVELFGRIGERRLVEPIAQRRKHHAALGAPRPVTALCASAKETFLPSLHAFRSFLDGFRRRKHANPEVFHGFSMVSGCFRRPAPDYEASTVNGCRIRKASSSSVCRLRDLDFRLCTKSQTKLKEATRWARKLTKTTLKISQRHTKAL